MRKVSIRINDDIINKIDEIVKELKYSSRNQFIVDSINFYIEQYRLTQLKTLPSSIETILSSNLDKLEQNVSSFLFKNAVETSMLTQVLAMIAEVDLSDLEILRSQTVELIKHSNGILDLEAIMKQQKKEGDK